MTKSQHVYDVRPRKDKRGVDVISDVLPFDRLWYIEPNAISNAIAYAKFRSPVTHAAIRVYDDAGNVIETHEHARRFSRVLTADCGGRELNGDYPSPVFMNQHGAPKHPPLRTV